MSLAILQDRESICRNQVNQSGTENSEYIFTIAQKYEILRDKLDKRYERPVH